MEREYRRSWIATIICLALFGLLSLARHCNRAEYQHDEGFIFGTLYHITYHCDHSLGNEIKERLLQFDASLSPFNDTSIVSRINRNEPVTTDPWFERVFNASQEIYQRTNGAFDPTLSPLINAWGFGFKAGILPDSAQVDSLLSQVGMDKLALVDHRIVKSDPAVTLNFSAIAKGYACDVIGELLEEHGIADFMVEIGGEIYARGLNAGERAWRIGVNRPTIADGVAGTIEEIVELTDAGLATSGNYRNYRIVDGKRIAHTIDPTSGYPIQHSLLSATVVAPNCATADAYATAFMVMGIERSRALLDSLPGIDALFLYQPGSDTTHIELFITDRLKKRLIR